MPVLDSTCIETGELEQELRSGIRPLVVDVCSPGEFACGHIPGAMNLPLEQLAMRIRDISWSPALVLVCQSGQRAVMAQQSLAEMGLKSRMLSGGLRAWSRAELPLVRSGVSRWALERQVRLGAGLLTLLGIGLSLILGTGWIALSGAAGVGLTMAGWTGFCPMAILLARMPWNRVQTSGLSSMGTTCSR